MKKGEEQVLDLYSGMGGFGTGFEKYFNVVAAVDKELDPCLTYKLNHWHCKVYPKDVESFVDTTLRRDFEGVVFTGVIGGPPCQEFSNLNHKADLNSDRAQQVFVFLKAIKQIQPEFAMMENVFSVPAVIKHQIVKSLKEMGYHVMSKIDIAHQYGSVQLRKRWLVTACKSRAVYPNPIHISKRKMAKDILRGHTSELSMSDAIKNAVQHIPSGKWCAIPGHKWKEYFVVDPEKPLPAIVNVTKNKLVNPQRTGYLSLTEVLLGQGFPEDYKIIGNNIGSKAQQLANAIPVELTTTFAREFFRRLYPDFNKIENFFNLNN